MKRRFFSVVGFLLMSVSLVGCQHYGPYGSGGSGGVASGGYASEAPASPVGFGGSGSR